MKTNAFYNGLMIIIIVSGAVTGATLLVSFVVFVGRVTAAKLCMSIHSFIHSFIHSLSHSVTQFNTLSPYLFVLVIRYYSIVRLTQYCLLLAS